MPEFYMILAEKLSKYPNFMIFARKINKIPQFCMIFARKMPKFFIIIAWKNIFSRILGGMCPPQPPAPISYAYVPIFISSGGFK